MSNATRTRPTTMLRTNFTTARMNSRSWRGARVRTRLRPRTTHEAHGTGNHAHGTWQHTHAHTHTRARARTHGNAHGNTHGNAHGNTHGNTHGSTPFFALFCSLPLRYAGFAHPHTHTHTASQTYTTTGCRNKKCRHNIHPQPHTHIHSD